jgi:hypothetical protein
MPKVKVIKHVVSKVKEIKKVKQEGLEREIDESEEEQFSTFMSGGSSGGAFIQSGQGEIVDQDVPRNLPGAPQVSTDEIEEPRSGMELYRIGQALGDRSGYVSNAVSSAPTILRSATIGRDFALDTGGSSLPDSPTSMGRSALEQDEIGGEKYDASTPASQAAKKFKYEWE